MPKLPTFIDEEYVESQSRVNRRTTPSAGASSGTYSPVPGGSGDADTNEIGPFVSTSDFESGINRFWSAISQLQRKLKEGTPHIQNVAARTIAQVYKNRLRMGVGDKLSPLTNALRGGDIHPPLARLAKYVTVVNGSGTKPAKVTFKKGWGKRAFLLHHGYTMDVTAHPNIRRRMLYFAEQATGKSASSFLDFGGTAPVWIVPPRPHIHMLDDPIMSRIMAEVALYIAAGRRLSPEIRFLITNEDEPDPMQAPFMASIDDVPI